MPDYVKRILKKTAIDFHSVIYERKPDNTIKTSIADAYKYHDIDGEQYLEVYDHAMQDFTDILVSSVVMVSDTFSPFSPQRSNHTLSEDEP